MYIDLDGHRVTRGKTWSRKSAAFLEQNPDKRCAPPS